MSEFTKPKNQAEWVDNFEQIKPLMHPTLAQQESSRCLFCYDAPCQKACPTSIDIPLFIRQIYTNNTVGAARTIYDSNYFGNICGKVCPTEVLCEGACVYNNQEQKPIEIGRLQSFATSYAIENGVNLYQAAAETGKKVAIVGAGPAGISAACELSRAGITVDIYEAKGQPSGLALHGVAPYKIENETVLEEINYLQSQLGFQTFYNQPISERAQLEKMEQNYDAIFLGIGMGKTNILGLAGENLHNCIGATEFVELLKLNPFDTFVGKRVVVVGGGNTAMDAASESARMGAEQVTLVYRKAKSEMGAYEFEYDLAKSVGVKGLFGYSPKAIIGDQDGKVQQIQFVDSQNPNEVRIIDCDMVILATGQAKQTDFLALIPALQTDKKGRICTNSDYQTTNPKYFAAGDAVNGGAEVVNAVAEAKKAAKAIINLLIG
jgi:dihydropyrimidine dehydrogenase (NAD+) subunit PreT